MRTEKRAPVTGTPSSPGKSTSEIAGPAIRESCTAVKVRATRKRRQRLDGRRPQQRAVFERRGRLAAGAERSIRISPRLSASVAEKMVALPGRFLLSWSDRRRSPWRENAWSRAPGRPGRRFSATPAGDRGRRAGTRASSGTSSRARVGVALLAVKFERCRVDAPLEPLERAICRSCESQPSLSSHQGIRCGGDPPQGAEVRFESRRRHGGGRGIGHRSTSAWRRSGRCSSRPSMRSELAKPRIE